MTATILACLALTAPQQPTPQQPTPHRQFLDKLVAAKFLKFHFERTITHQSLPDDPRPVVLLAGTMTLARDGRWRWDREDGWSLLHDGRETYKTATGSEWYEETVALDSQGTVIDEGHVRELFLGLDPFLNGAWKGVRGSQDWWGAGNTDWSGQDVLVLVRPKTAADVRDARNGDLTAGVWLYVDARTLNPLHAESWDSNSQDRREDTARYTKFEFDPPGAEAALTKKGD